MAISVSHALTGDIPEIVLWRSNQCFSAHYPAGNNPLKKRFRALQKNSHLRFALVYHSMEYFSIQEKPSIMARLFEWLSQNSKTIKNSFPDLQPLEQG
ncbi:hypothetical protein [Vampirovibrio chlorellavorus]|uniref:hypothetical protein n=1 Tax=Vampirovibrio chlorellavorus TaxID=758823 RepID=UPI0026F2A759|nr:hypothetical protein [Vampirovibrio chlorellavorus]